MEQQHDWQASTCSACFNIILARVSVSMTRIATLKTLSAEYVLESDVPLGPIVEEWNELLEDHEVWNRFEKSKAQRKKKSAEHLKQLGLNLDETAMRKVANAGLVEIEVESTGDPLAWHLPWEYWLTAATERLRSRAQSLLVLRFLKKTETRETQEPSKLLVFKSNPEYLANLYSDGSLKYEETNVSGNIDFKIEREAHNLTVEELQKLVSDYGPDVIHVAGVDSWQATRFKYAGQAEELSLKGVQRGLMVKTPNDTADIADTDDLVKALCSHRTPPRLIALNFSSSASIAAATVKAGAHGAIGFYSDIDDIIAESFFTNFYLAWRLSEWNLLDAFRQAWDQLVEEIKPEKLFGSGIVLWANESLLEKEKSRRAELSMNTSPSKPSPALQDKFDKEATQTLTADPINHAIEVRIKEMNELNYCLLHNNRNLFHWFFVRKLIPRGVLRDVAIHVWLHIGSERLAFRVRKDLRYPIWNLVDSVRIPLTATLPRALQESIYTGLNVRVTVGNTAVFENTFRVNLLPIDQWQNDDENRQWLPSFILPRDPAIRQLVDVAQKYLAAISDDPRIGFNAYMAGKPEAADAQVKALWFALLSDFSLSYITEPPSFKDKAQRLRNPSSVIQGKRGTCIDLALLFAAALEYIEIYRVIVLFAGHALVGFYRSKQAHDKVREHMDRNASSDEQAWMLGKSIQPVILEMINSKELVGLEAVGLTKHQSFESALAEGTNKITRRVDFEYLVDVRLAREGGVTPLPIQA